MNTQNMHELVKQVVELSKRVNNNSKTIPVVDKKKEPINTLLKDTLTP